MLDNKRVEIIEVGPRDGFQNVSEFIPTQEKLKIIDGIVSSGIKSIQITSFVSPKAIPQMKDAKALTKKCLQLYPEVNLFALVPNFHGAQIAKEAGLKEISYVISLSKTHNQNNVKKTHDASFEELSKILEELPQMKVNLDIATTFGCPFEGKFPVEDIIRFINRGYRMGVRSFNLCDTVGLSNPKEIIEVITSVFNRFTDCEFQIHIHDTRNMGIINTFTAIKCGVNKVQTAIGGLGGCPFAPGASGNTSTEDLVYMLNEMNYKTGIEFRELLETAKYSVKKINGNFSGHHIEIDMNNIKVQ